MERPKSSWRPPTCYYYLDAFAVRTGLTQFAFGPRVLGGRHHLHGLRDLLDVRHGLQAHRDLFQRGHVTVLLLSGGGALPDERKKKRARISVSATVLRAETPAADGEAARRRARGLRKNTRRVQAAARRPPHDVAAIIVILTGTPSWSAWKSSSWRRACRVKQTGKQETKFSGKR